MTTKKIFAAAFAALFMTAFNACTKEEAPAAPEVPGADETLVEMTLTAVQAVGESAAESEVEPSQAAVKSTFDGTQIGWETDDLVAIYDGTAKRQFTVESVENGVATLKGMVSPDATEFYAVFPYSAAGDALPTQKGQVSLNIPAVQTLSEGKNFDEDAFVTVGKVQDGNVVLKNAVSVLKLNIPEGVSSVRLQGFAYENISGGVYASSDAVAGEGAVSSITLKPSGASFEAGEHYIALLPTKFTAGFKVIYSKEGAMAVVKTTSPVDFPRKGGFNITESTANLTWLANPIMTEADLRAYFANQAAFAGETAKLGQDITLTSAWTPVALTGTFDGCNYAISGVNVSAKGNVGFFSKVQSGASVKNLTIEGTITALRPNSAAKSIVGVAGVVEGTGVMTNVTNKASIVLANDIAWTALVGGIAGNLISGGTLNGCVNKGSITSEGAAQKDNGTYETWYLGGIAGYLGDSSGTGWSNNNAGGTVAGCVNEGAMTISNPAVESIGGVVGMFRGGKISGCENKGSFVVTNTLSNGRLGGIAGYVQNRSGKKAEIIGSTNNAALDLTGKATTLTSVGGVVGICHHQDFEVEISSCYNKKPVSVSTVKTVSVAGVVADYGNDKGTALVRINGCHNEAAIMCVNLVTTTAYVNAKTYVGGIAAHVGAVTEFDSCVNSGTVSSNNLTTNYVAGTAAHVAGTTTIKNCINSGDVLFNSSKTIQVAGWVGGIVGYATGALTMIGNTNAVDGDVTMSINNNESERCSIGGVVGFTDASSHKMTGNINKATVWSDCTKAFAPAGGVVGLIRGNAEMNGNINFGDVTATSDSTGDTVTAGGLVGYFDMKGEKGATTNKTATLTGDKSFGHIKSKHSAGTLFGICLSDCYGNINIKDCVVGGKITAQRPNSTTGKELTKDNFASTLWAYVKKEVENVSFFQKNTTFGVASAYASAQVEEAGKVSVNW